MYTEITDPATGNTVSIYSIEGEKIIQQYVNFLNGGGETIPANIAATTSSVGIIVGSSLALLAAGLWVIKYYTRRNNPEDIVELAQPGGGLSVSPMKITEPDIGGLRLALEQARHENDKTKQLLDTVEVEAMTPEKEENLLEEVKKEVAGLELRGVGSDNTQDNDLNGELGAMLVDPPLGSEDEVVLHELTSGQTNGVVDFVIESASAFAVTIIAIGVGTWTVLTCRPEPPDPTIPLTLQKHVPNTQMRSKNPAAAQCQISLSGEVTASPCPPPKTPL